MTCLFLRPVNEDFQRVTPSALIDHRKTHIFQAPSCLCAFGSSDNSYIECAIYVAPDGPFFNEYVAGCRNDHCGYIGTLSFSFVYVSLQVYLTVIPLLVCLERMYSRQGLYLKKYPVRRMSLSFNLVCMTLITCLCSCSYCGLIG